MLPQSLNALFVGEPIYDENGRFIKRKNPPIVWIAVIGVFLYYHHKSNEDGD